MTETSSNRRERHVCSNIIVPSSMQPRRKKRHGLRVENSESADKLEVSKETNWDSTRQMCRSVFPHSEYQRMRVHSVGVVVPFFQMKDALKIQRLVLMEGCRKNCIHSSVKKLLHA